ncbi:hypothetical protein [Chryseobacterium daecheongense]|nr:hypothetical protein [Chryseobacterium daecheongense]
MKKLLLIATVFVAGFLSANTGVVASISDNLKDIEKKPKKR